MRLTRAGWNNVIIFSVMAFILMINMTNQKLFNEDEPQDVSSAQSIVGEGNVILTLMINQQMTVEREGLSWRTLPAGTLTTQAVEQMMRSWHSATGEPIVIDFERNRYDAVMVSMMIAGKSNIHLYSLYPLADQLIVFNHQLNTYISLPPQFTEQLLPVEIFK